MLKQQEQHYSRSLMGLQLLVLHMESLQQQEPHHIRKVMLRQQEPHHIRKGMLQQPRPRNHKEMLQRLELLRNRSLEPPLRNRKTVLQQELICIHSPSNVGEQRGQQVRLEPLRNRTVMLQRLEPLRSRSLEQLLRNRKMVRLHIHKAMPQLRELLRNHRVTLQQEQHHIRRAMFQRRWLLRNRKEMLQRQERNRTRNLTQLLHNHSRHPHRR
jgi:hypothetical protein